MREDLKPFFLDPKQPKHRQYEALRAYVVDEKTAEEAAREFGFTKKSLFALAHDLRVGKLDFFPKTSTGPQGRRVAPAVLQGHDQHRCGRGLAVCAGNGNAGLAIHQAAEKIGPLDHRDSGSARCNDFGIVIQDGGGTHHQVSAYNVHGVVTDMDGCTRRLQSACK